MSFKSLSIVAAAALSMCAGAAHALVTVNGFANGGFENPAVVAGQFAQGWRGTNGPTPGNVTTAEAHTGTHSALMSVVDPGFGGSGIVQNSVDDGGLLALDSSNWGTSPTLSFWAKGSASVTGVVNYSLRYLDSVGNILNPVVNTQFQGLLSGTSWTEITKSGVVIPVNTSAVFLEMTLATGPTGITTNPDGSVSNYGQARVYIDDVNLSVAAVPEPETYALMLAGLGAIGSIVRRRRSA
jgi:PEP-CTERM motif